MKALAARAHIAELARRGASESRLPTINFFGTWGEQGLSAPSAIPSYIYQVTVDVPLFTGGRIRAEMTKADLELKKVDQERSRTAEPDCLGSENFASATRRGAA